MRPRTHIYVCWIVLFSTTGLIGCNSGDPAAPVADSPDQPAAATTDDTPTNETSKASAEGATGESGGSRPTDATADEGISARVASWESTEQLIADQAGKVVVVDLWSTSCVPCIREFPNLVALQQQHPQELVCISFNLDYIGLPKEPPEFVRDKYVMPILEQHEARLINVVSSDPDEKVYEKLNLAAIPAVYVYDRGGELRKRFDNEEAATPEDEFTYQKNVIPLVEELLAAEP